MDDSKVYPAAKQPCVARHSTAEHRAHSGGFTLIELMLAVAIVGTLSSLAVPSYLGFLEKARVARVVAEMNSLAKEIRLYALNEGQYPDSLSQIGSSSTWLDRWGNPYQYFRINCEVGLILGRLDNLESPAIGAVGLVLPVSVALPPVNAHVFLAADVGDHLGLIYLIQGNGGGNAGGGNAGGGNAGGGGPPCGSIGGARKYRFLVPINSDFDLYSMGADGKSVGPLTAKNSHDDVIRANDGGFYGLASNF